jgi:periplasmic protein TonB
MSIKIFSVNLKDRLIIFFLISILIHLGVLMIIPKTREGKQALPKLLPIDVIEIPQPTDIKKPLTSGGNTQQKTEKRKKTEKPHPLLPSVSPSIKEKRIEEPPLPFIPPPPPSEQVVSKGGSDEDRQKKAIDNEDSLPLQKSIETGNRVLEEKAEQKPSIKKESVADEKAFPAEPIIKEERPLTLYPTKERLAELSKKYEKEIPAGEKDRDISFDTSELRYTSYFKTLKAKIYHEWEYPDAAARGGLTGILFIRFVIMKDGRLEEVTLTKSSGYPMLDNAAISAIRLAAPFYPFDKSFGSLEKITVNASFEYVLYPYINRQR